MFKRYAYCEGLTHLLGSEGAYLINLVGNVKNKYGDDVPYKLDADGHRVVIVRGWDGMREYRVVDLMAVQFKLLHRLNWCYGKVIGFVINGDKGILHAENIGYRFSGGPIEVPGSEGFFYIPGYPNAAISRQGELLRLDTLALRKWFVIPPDTTGKNAKGGYRVTSVPFNRGESVSISRHRLLMLAFSDYPDDCDFLVVNHIDGIPGNDTLDNLEWLTRADNLKHAYVTNLRSQNKRVLVRYVLSGEVLEFCSISEAANVLGWASDETIRQRLIASKFGTVFQDGTQVKFKDDERDWVHVPDPKKAIFEAQEKVPVRAKNCFTGEEIVFDSAIYASEGTGVQSGTISRRCRRDLGRPCYGWQFLYAHSDKKFPYFSLDEAKDSLAPDQEGYPALAKNLLTGEVTRYETARSLAKGIGTIGFHQALREGKQPVTKNGYQIKYDDGSEWETVDNVEKMLYEAQKEIVLRDENSGEQIRFTQSKDAAIFLGMSCPKAVRQAALTRGNKVIRGYRARLGVSDEPWPV